MFSRSIYGDISGNKTNQVSTLWEPKVEGEGKTIKKDNLRGNSAASAVDGASSGGWGGPGVFTVAGALCSAQSPQGKGQGLAKAWRGEGVNQVVEHPRLGEEHI